jgi:TonB-dependent receptor
MLDPNSTLPTATYPTTTGAGKYATATPLEILTKSAAANTKADCYAAFPQLTTGAPTLANLASSDRTAAVNVRTNELATCLNQWNDYTPSLIRNVIRREIDKREDLDLRADFKVNNELTVYAKGSYNKRRIDNNQLTYGLGGLNVNTAGTFVDTAGVRTVAPAAVGTYFPYPGSYTIAANQPLVSGAVANVNPASVTVDSTHHVTQFTITDGAANTDQVHSIAETTAKYLQLGGTWRRDALTAEFFVADSKSDFTREDKRTSFNLPYGTATLSVLPSGLWSYAFPANTTLNQSNPAGYVYLVPGAASSAVAASAANINSIPAYSAGQQPLYTQSAQVTYTPQIRGTEEKTAKLDLTYALSDQVPFLQRVKAGFNLRDTSYKAWGGGGVTISAAQGTYGTPGYVPPVIVPAALVRSFFQGCQDTAGSLGPGGNKCPSGYVQSNSYSTANSGTVYMTPAQFQSIIAASLSGNATATSFFNGAKGAPSGLVSNWTQIDVDKALTLTGAPNLNMNCVITCKANDGKVYEQPVSKIKERTDAFYLMGDYNIDRVPFTQRSLPFGWELEGNIGWRDVRTKVNGIGAMAFTSITKTGAYDVNNPNAAAGISTVTVTSNTPVNATVHDFLPIYNAALWVVPDQVVLRYNRARTVARPPVTYLLPAGTCTYDERLGSGSGANDVVQRCSGTIGNPLLQAQKNLNQNWSAEYYPGKDTMLSLAYFKQKGIVGPALTQGVSGGSLLGGSSVTDANGKALNDLKFDYTTYINGVPTTRKGWEFGAKTAFTFLPSYLRFTGLDANYTRLASVTSTQNVVDLLTGDPLPPLRESKSSYNWALWYDDGKLQLRVAVQGVDRFFQCIAACTANTVNNYPNAYGNQRALPWNPGSPNFRDATRFVDAKVSYKINQNFEVFLEGRNLGKATTSDSQGQYVPFASGTPSILAYNYAGRRIMAGLNFRYGG